METLQLFFGTLGMFVSGTTIANGNMYGSSNDIGTINVKMPALTDVGGRVPSTDSWNNHKVIYP